MRSFQIAYGQLHPVLFWPRTTNSDLKFETRRRICCCKVQNANVQLYQPSLLVIGGGAAGVYGAIKAKSVMPQLKVTVIEKGKILSKVLISGGGRCNLTNAHFVNTELLADQYPRGTKELRGLYFKSHGPSDTMAWFSEHGVQLKTEDDGRVFPVSFSKVIAWLKIPELHRNVPQLKQVGSMLITHWGLSGPAILRLSAWAARILYETKYKGTLLVDFVPDIAVDDITQLLQRHKKKHLGEFKDEFVTAGGISLSEINLKTMESRKQPNLFLAGEVINVDGLTGGFNLQNAWTSAYLAGTSIGLLASQSINSSINEEPCLLDQF